MSSNTPIAGQNGTAIKDVPRTKICVFCGSSGGASPAHMEAARQLGRIMAENNIDLGKLFSNPSINQTRQFFN
jgi:predicted Rossmann-fold nucleotide-binding protein